MDKLPSPIKKTPIEKYLEWSDNQSTKHTPGYIGKADRREFSQEDIDYFISLVNKFKINHSMEDLLVITDSNEENQKIRIAARDDLNIIHNFLKKLQNETKIAQSQLEELNKEYQTISQAIGMLNRSKIDHILG